MSSNKLFTDLPQVPAEHLNPEIAQVALEKQSRAIASDKPLKPLRKYAEAGDDTSQYRVRTIIFQVVLPICGVIFLLLNFTGFFKSPAPTAQAAAEVPTKSLAVVPTSSALMLGGGPLPGSAFGGAPAAVSTRDLRVRCYATVDVRSVYSDTQVLANGLFFAEKFTRVNGGLIYNSRFGWYRSSDFGCASGLDSIEVEFQAPKSPTTIPTRKPIVFATSTLVPTPAPSPTLSNGLALFKNDGCSVSWLAWNVRAVYLTVGNTREGVPGDNYGVPVIKSVCPYSGTVKIDVVGWDSLTIHRELVIK